MNYKFTTLIVFLIAILVIIAEPAYPEQDQVKTPDIKFTLVIFLCSFINNECLPPAEIKQSYNSWKECTIAALEISKEIMLSQEDIFVNNNKVATKFVCAEIGTI